MNRILYIIGIMVLLILLAGCNSDEVSQIENEFAQLEEKYQLLLTENTELKKENESLSETITIMSKDYKVI